MANEIWLIAGPRRRFVTGSPALPVNIDEDHKPISVLLPQEFLLFEPTVAENPVEASTDRDAVAVHDLQVFIPSLSRPAQSPTKVSMNIDNGKLRSFSFVARDFQLGARAEFAERQIVRRRQAGGILSHQRRRLKREAEEAEKKRKEEEEGKKAEDEWKPPVKEVF